MSLNRIHGDKRVGELVHRSTKTNIGSLPKDLLVGILARVASSSFTDVYNAKLSCKDFLELTEDDYIFEHISINKFPLIHWHPPGEKVSSFLTHCFNKGNSESLFRQGMIEYFKLANVESGLECLTRAVKKGHAEATYVYGMILLARGDEWSQQGLDLLNSMKYSKSRDWNVKDCRDKVDIVLSQMWINNLITLGNMNPKCRKQDHIHAIWFIRRTGWSDDIKDDEISSCDTCLWYRELICCTMMVDNVH